MLNCHKIITLTIETFRKRIFSTWIEFMLICTERQFLASGEFCCHQLGKSLFLQYATQKRIMNKMLFVMIS